MPTYIHTEIHQSYVCMRLVPSDLLVERNNPTAGGKNMSFFFDDVKKDNQDKKDDIEWLIKFSF